jgi:hypothetical protein
MGVVDITNNSFFTIEPVSLDFENSVSELGI